MTTLATRGSRRVTISSLARWWAVAVVAVIVAMAAATQPYPNGPSIRGDGLGYHIWIRAFLERGVAFCGYPELESVGAIAARDPEREICLNKYTPGLALLRFPVMAPLVDRSADAPLVSVAEHHANATLSALALILTTVLILASAFRLGARSLPANVAVLAAVFGTGLFHYATYDSSITHIYVALGVSFLLWLGVRLLPREPTPWPATVLIGTACFFIVSMRTLHVLIVGTFVLVYLGWRRATGDVRNHVWVDRAVLAAVAGSIVAVLLQVSYNYLATGRLALSSYGDERFVFDHPMQSSVFVSYGKGLFTWYPVLVVLLGVGLLVRQTRWAALVVIALIAAYGTVFGFWHSWFLGGGFGHRGFVDLMPLAAIVGAVALGLVPRATAIATATAAAICTAVTVSLMLGYWRGTVPFQGADAATYRNHIIGEDSIFTP